MKLNNRAIFGPNLVMDDKPHEYVRIRMHAQIQTHTLTLRPRISLQVCRFQTSVLSKKMNRNPCGIANYFQVMRNNGTNDGSKYLTSYYFQISH